MDSTVLYHTMATYTVRNLPIDMIVPAGWYTAVAAVARCIMVYRPLV